MKNKLNITTFKKNCGHQKFTGRGIRVNALYYDYKQGEIDGKYFGGWKYQLVASTKFCSKEYLCNLLFGIVTNQITPEALPTYAKLKVASTDMERFKFPLSLNYETN